MDLSSPGPGIFIADSRYAEMNTMTTVHRRTQSGGGGKLNWVKNWEQTHKDDDGCHKVAYIRFVVLQRREIQPRTPRETRGPSQLVR